MLNLKPTVKVQLNNMLGARETVPFDIEGVEPRRMSCCSFAV
jgi:hypothetical protein